MMDASVSRIVDAYADNLVAIRETNNSSSDQTEELDVDELFDALDNEDDGVIRERRLAQLQRE
jgi:Ca2+-binding EF-hand superfamily protein